jgi:hypothetical protein
VLFSKLSIYYSQEKKNIKKFAKTISNKVDKVGEKAKKNLSRVNLHMGDGSSGKKNSIDHDTSEERDKVSMPSPLPNKFSIKELDKGKNSHRYCKIRKLISQLNLVIR